MPRDFTAALWALKLGAGVNLYLIATTLSIATPDPHVVGPALILLSVSVFRCLFPNRYVDNVVFHDTPASSIFLTRALATCSEVAYIYQFAYVLRALAADGPSWVTAASWLMVAQVVLSQGFVWGAIVTRRIHFYFFEELGWFVIFAANTIASGALWMSHGRSPDSEHLLLLNLVFGAFYLPWQVLHLRSLRIETMMSAGRTNSARTVAWRDGLRDALYERNRRTDAASWGGAIGLTWMVAYWASLIPSWVAHIARTMSS